MSTQSFETHRIPASGMLLDSAPALQQYSGKGIRFISHNSLKHADLTSVAPELGHQEADIPEIQSLVPQEVLEAKLREAARLYSGEIIVDDTSFVIAGRASYPGPLIKWVLHGCPLEEIVGFGHEEHGNKAQMIVTLGYHDGKGTFICAEASVTGELVPPRNGPHGKGLDDIFKPDGSDKTFSEMTDVERATLSMRTAAARKLFEKIEAHKASQHSMLKNYLPNRRTFLAAGAAALSAVLLKHLHDGKVISDEELAAASVKYQDSLRALERIGAFSEDFADLHPEVKSLILRELQTALVSQEVIFKYHFEDLDKKDLTTDQQNHLMAYALDWGEAPYNVQSDHVRIPELWRQGLGDSLPSPAATANVDIRIAYLSKLTAAKRALLLLHGRYRATSVAQN